MPVTRTSWAALMLLSMLSPPDRSAGKRVRCEGCETDLPASDPAGSYACPHCGHVVYVDPGPPAA